MQRDVANETVKIIFLKSILLATWGHLGYHKSDVGELI